MQGQILVKATFSWHTRFGRDCSLRCRTVRRRSECSKVYIIGQKYQLSDSSNRCPDYICLAEFANWFSGKLCLSTTHTISFSLGAAASQNASASRMLRHAINDQTGAIASFVHVQWNDVHKCCTYLCTFVGK